MKAIIGVLAAALMLAATNLGAGSVGETCYVAKLGKALSSCVPEFDANGALVDPCPETIGNYWVVLARATRGRGQPLLVLAGPFRGLANLDGTLNHVLANKTGKGLLYTFGDSFVEPPVPDGECLLHVKEALNVTFGTGAYVGAHGTLLVNGTLNICTGVNEFDVARDEGELCFGEVPKQEEND